MVAQQELWRFSVIKCSVRSVAIQSASCFETMHSQGARLSRMQILVDGSTTMVRCGCFSCSSTLLIVSARVELDVHKLVRIMCELGSPAIAQAAARVAQLIQYIQDYSRIAQRGIFKCAFADPRMVWRRLWMPSIAAFLWIGQPPHDMRLFLRYTTLIRSENTSHVFSRQYERWLPVVGWKTPALITPPFTDTQG